MKYTLHFLPEVENDIVSGYHWYEEKAVGLGEEFLRIFYANAYELHRNPLPYQKIYLEFRRCLLKRFPYAVYYRIENNMIIVFGVFHCARDPRSIKEILKDRDTSEKI